MKKIILFIFVLILMPLVSSGTVIQTNVNTDTGLDIEVVHFDSLKNDVYHVFNTHVFNISSGLPVNNQTTSCDFHLYDNLGEHIVDEVDMVFDLVNQHWELNITRGNFTMNGEYNYLISCNSTLIGGFTSVGFLVTADGENYDQARAITYISFLVLLVFIFLITMISIRLLPHGNIKSETGDLLSINYLKFLTYLLYPLAWFLLIAVMFTASNIGIATGIILFGNLFFVMFQIMMKLTIIMIVVWFLWILLMVFRDREFKKLLDRGFDMGGRL